MVVLNVTYTCKNVTREEFLGAIRAEGLDEACRAEAGNLKYDYYLAADNDYEIMLVENWCDRQAFDSHCSEPHFKRLGELKTAMGVESQLRIYDVAD